MKMTLWRECEISILLALILREPPHLSFKRPLWLLLETQFWAFENTVLFYMINYTDLKSTQAWLQTMTHTKKKIK